ncbi:sensor histidine kinase [Burkholderiaceae bacterium UC74_6]
MSTVPTNRIHRLKRQVLILVVIAGVVAVGVTLAMGDAFPRALLYSLCITACCSAGAQLMHAAVAKLRGGKRVGGLLLALVSLLGALPGYQIGYWIADALTGTNSPTLFEASPRQLAFLIFLIAVPSLVASYYFRSREQLAQAQAQAAEHQLQLLQAQLEPHMLFNTLANLRVLIRQDPQRAQGMLDQLISFLRATLQASRSGSHSLSDEFARLNDYLALMQVRMQDRLRPRLELPPELAEAQIPPLLLQPLVENAIKHGLEPQVEGGELIVSARSEGDGLVLEVRDTGAGLSTVPSEGTHFGLHQIRERLATRYGADAQFTLTAHPEGGALARIRIPAAP